MLSRITTCLAALAVVVVLALPGRVAAQQHANAPYPYVLLDLGTFGGPQSALLGLAHILNNRGMVVGIADTTLPDPYYPNNNPLLAFYGSPDPNIQHGFAWQKGVLTDLGALPGANSSNAGWINARGDVIGISNNGTTDPLLGFPDVDGVLWQDGRLINLGTLGGNESLALAINDPGQVVGIAANTVPDPFSLAGWGTQTRAFLWQHGQMRDLGTLGGPDAWAWYVNNRGQVAGQSYTSAISNTTTGIPTMDPFLWQDGRMRDLGNLGGTLSFVDDLNNRGEVVGQSNLAGDQSGHPFLWDGHVLKDLGTLGGNNGSANWLNDAGDVVGTADVPGNQIYHAFLWSKGVMMDLGVAPGDTCSSAENVNRWGQVVGASGLCQGAVDATLWTQGASLNVNTLIAPSDLHVTEALEVNDWGEIAGIGVFPNGAQHAVLLVPTRLAESEGITSNAPAPGTTGPAVAVHRSSAACRMPPWRTRLAQRYPRRCFGA